MTLRKKIIEEIWTKKDMITEKDKEKLIVKLQNENELLKFRLENVMKAINLKKV